MNDPKHDVKNQSTAGGVTTGSALGRKTGDPHAKVEPHPDPDHQPVTYGDEAVDVDDDDAVARALTDGRRDLIDASKMSLERRMQFGLLTPEDDKLRVEGRLGDHMSTHDGKAAKSNAFDGKAGSENRNTK